MAILIPIVIQLPSRKPAFSRVEGAIVVAIVKDSARDVFRYAFHRVDRPPSSPEEAMAIVRANPMIVEKPVGDPTEPPIAPERAPKPPPAPEPPADDSPPEAFENDRT